jgi:hypothetical protein
LLYLLETKVAGAKIVWGGREVTPSKSKFFFFSKSLYLVEKKVAGAKNVWGM